MIINGFGGAPSVSTGQINTVTLQTFNFTQANAVTNTTTTTAGNDEYWIPSASQSFVMPNAYTLKIVVNSISWSGTIAARSSRGTLDVYIYITFTSYAATGVSTSNPVTSSNYLYRPYVGSSYTVTSTTAVNISTITPTFTASTTVGNFPVAYVNVDFNGITRQAPSVSSGNYEITPGNTYYLTLVCRQSSGSYANVLTNSRITATNITLQYVLP